MSDVNNGMILRSILSVLTFSLMKKKPHTQNFYLNIAVLLYLLDMADNLFYEIRNTNHTEDYDV